MGSIVHFCQTVTESLERVTVQVVGLLCHKSVQRISMKRMLYSSYSVYFKSMKWAVFKYPDFKKPIFNLKGGKTCPSRDITIFPAHVLINASSRRRCGRGPVFLGNPLKCPNSKRFFFQDGVDEGQRHRPVASQQTGIHGRALDAPEHRFSPHSVSNRQHKAVLFELIAAGEAQTPTRDAASPQADGWRGGFRTVS